MVCSLGNISKGLFKYIDVIHNIYIHFPNGNVVYMLMEMLCCLEGNWILIEIAIKLAERKTCLIYG